MDTALSFWFQHLPVIIEALVVLILIGVIYVNVVLLKNRTQGGGSGDLDDIERSLKKILAATETKGGFSFDQGSTKRGAVGNEGTLGATGGEGSASNEVVRQLETEISSKENKIKSLEEEVKKFQEASQKKVEGPSREELDKKVKDLEAKLADYEIIEDDIADLTLYKDENQRLKAEIEALKKAGPSLQPASTASTPPPPSKPDAVTTGPQNASEGDVDDDLMAEFAAAVADQKAGTLDSNKNVKVADMSAGDVDDDLMAEFAAAVADQKAGTLDSEKKEEAVASESGSDEVDEDLMAEFAAAVAEQKAGTLKDETESTPIETAIEEVVVQEVEPSISSDAVEEPVEVAAEALEEVIEEVEVPKPQVVQTKSPPPPTPALQADARSKYRSGDDIFEEFLVEETSFDVESEMLESDSIVPTANLETDFSDENSESLKEVSVDMVQSPESGTPAPVQEAEAQDVKEEVDKDGSVVISIDGSTSEISQGLLDQLKSSMYEDPAVTDNDSITDELMEEFRSIIVGKKRKKLPERKIKINIVESKPVAKVSGDPMDYQLDTEKMISEVANLEVMDDNIGGSALNEELNTDKMLSEVDALNALSTGGTDES